jgi:hypothetical protein
LPVEQRKAKRIEIMNRVSKIAVAAAIASLSFAGISYADSAAMNWGPELEKTLTTFVKGFDVKQIGDYQNQKVGSDAEDTTIPRSAEAVEHIQAAIRSNKPLAAKLEAKGVNLKDVVNAQQAADGTVTFWTR